MQDINSFGPVPMKHEMLLNLLADYSAPNNKIISLISAGELIRLKRGLYVASPGKNGTLLSPELIANHLLGPSYVSIKCISTLWNDTGKGIFNHFTYH